MQMDGVFLWSTSEKKTYEKSAFVTKGAAMKYLSLKLPGTQLFIKMNLKILTTYLLAIINAILAGRI